MATDITAAGANTSPAENVGEINKYDFHTTSKAVFKARKGIDAENRQADFGTQG